MDGAVREAGGGAGVVGDPNAQALLEQHFGFSEFLPGQLEAIQCLLRGDSAAAVFPTGGGKSICYQLPALAFSGVTLVVSPLIALMKDQIDALTAKKIPAVRLDSTLTLDEYRSAVDRLRAGELKIVYVAPERFNNERFRSLIQQIPISLFAVDEAHCISEWGHAFRPDYLKLARFADEFKAERRLALTATAPPKVLDDICREFSIRPECAIRTGFYRSNLSLRCSPAASSERDRMLVDRIRDRDRAATIVYVTLQKTAMSVAQMLNESGISARPYHAGLKAEDRAETQEWFLQSDDAVIVATIAFGMGIDKPDIRYVYHYNLAKSLENYSQEIGRAGRDGLESVCESLVCADDLRTLENFAYGDTPTRSAVESFARDIFDRGSEFAVSLYDLQREHDIRDLVLRTLLTYLELDGFLKSGTPFYGEYRFKPLTSSADMLCHFEGERREFVQDLLKLSIKAKTLFTLDIDRAVKQLGSDRQRVVRAMDYLAERGWMELRTGQLRHRFTKLKAPQSMDDFVDELHGRCVQRQESELARLRGMFDLMSLDGCQTNALAAHFGEMRDSPCGHCNWCFTGHAIKVPNATSGEIAAGEWDRLSAIRRKIGAALDDPVLFARFACGIKSPRLIKEKLTRHGDFGLLTNRSYGDVLKKAACS